jgi:hypothetical protein
MLGSFAFPPVAMGQNHIGNEAERLNLCILPARGMTQLDMEKIDDPCSEWRLFIRHLDNYNSSYDHRRATDKKDSDCHD